MFNGKSADQKNRVQNLWDFSDKKKKSEKKKIRTTTIAFPLRCGKAKKLQIIRYADDGQDMAQICIALWEILYLFMVANHRVVSYPFVSF